MKAAITAGGRLSGAYAAAAGTPIKALASVRGSSMLERILRALREAGVARIAVVGGNDVRAACAGYVDAFVEESASGRENVRKALGAWPEDGEPLLYATSDLPYVTASAVRDFVGRVPAGTLAMALAESADFNARFPGAPPCGITLAGERVVNGDLFVIPPGSAGRLAALAARFFDARKRPWRMAALASPLALLRLGTGRLSIAQLEGMAEGLLGVSVRAVRGCAPELGFDADTADDYRYACAHA